MQEWPWTTINLNASEAHNTSRHLQRALPGKACTCHKIEKSRRFSITRRPRPRDTAASADWLWQAPVSTPGAKGTAGRYRYCRTFRLIQVQHWVPAQECIFLILFVLLLHAVESNALRVGPGTSEWVFVQDHFTSRLNVQRHVIQRLLIQSVLSLVSRDSCVFCLLPQRTASIKLRCWVISGHLGLRAKHTSIGT